MTNSEIPSAITPFIMCGGSGTRLWPVSRASMPKQFQSFFGARSLLQDTAVRVTGPGFAPPVFVASEAHRFLVADQIEALGIPRGPIVLEPVGRNTAAVALVASLMTEKHDPDGLVLLLPSDHLVKDADAFRALVLEAAPAARAGSICLFGIAPNRPETGYGYIEVGDDPVPDQGSPVRKVVRFIEKPGREAAERLLEAGNNVWNSGIFLFSARAMLAEAEERRQDLLAGVRHALDTADRDQDFVRLEAAAFGAVESISVDYAIMEGSQRTAVLPATIDWNDLGAWDAIYGAHVADGAGNVLLGRAVGHDTRNSIIRSDRQVVATVGVENLVVVATDDAVLVADKAQAQGVKQALELLRTKGFAEADTHSEMHRPWGSYRSLISGDRFQVKLITVKPGGRLSLQLHRHRAEHWVVVKGTAQITCGERVFMLYENQSTYIPQGETHRLENPGHIPLEMIEVQSGAYLGEDDIVRVEDVYGRS
ncbi:mannose-1-phosphate guanylyltransferase/mannose-6-phosphate isomerase [Enterovirga aerilata]|uniref:mannose-1-phosphate guanylyltransferase n=1 Tax=Enterovirga aerilata TaxID=2730920 RepID=A0A849I618_9HYPH|nr:mannose-1-phosphate guanylyltransferase/mannose-6-phosphate isomerase [Enterovirga sp. DB1703]NNM71775.1 mannose-1-phosphate guanylyltransferase/mannose-6-phosphate isomerase [Enterovirga sp. DB1703]